MRSLLKFRNYTSFENDRRNTNLQSFKKNGMNVKIGMVFRSATEIE